MEPASGHLSWYPQADSGKIFLLAKFFINRLKVHAGIVPNH